MHICVFLSRRNEKQIVFPDTRVLLKEVAPLSYVNEKLTGFIAKFQNLINRKS